MLSRVKNDERGVALIASIGISLILMLVAFALAYRVGYFTKATYVSKKRDQAIYIADYGLESLRYYFWEQDCTPPDWCSANYRDTANPDAYVDFISLKENDTNNAVWFSSLIAESTLTAKDKDGNVIKTVTHSIDHTNETGLVTMVSGSRTETYNYQIYTKGSATPDIVYALISAEKASGTEQKESEFVERSSVEVAIFFSVPCEDYKQFGQCRSKEGASRTGQISAEIQQAL